VLGVLTSVVGTFRTWRDVRFESAIWVEPGFATPVAPLPLDVVQALAPQGRRCAKAINGATALTAAKDAKVRTLLVKAGAKP
jgi:hypothetical protein